MKLVRTWLPVTIIVAGVIAAAATGFSETGVEGGAGIVGAGLAVWLLNFLYRIGVRGERERDEEAQARVFFDEHGYWPDEEPPQPRPDRHRAPHRSEPIDSGHGRRRRR